MLFAVHACALLAVWLTDIPSLLRYLLILVIFMHAYWQGWRLLPVAGGNAVRSASRDVQGVWTLENGRGKQLIADDPVVLFNHPYIVALAFPRSWRPAWLLIFCADSLERESARRLRILLNSGRR